MATLRSQAWCREFGSDVIARGAAGGATVARTSRRPRIPFVVEGELFVSELMRSAPKSERDVDDFARAFAEEGTPLR